MTDITTIAAHCLHCGKPMCRLHCPANTDTPTFLAYVKDGNLQQAVQTVGHPFGEVCGYICPHDEQCRGNCVLSRRGQAVDMPLCERTVFGEVSYDVARRGTKLVGKHVAVVGGGVSGVTFAVKCYEEGADVTLYEANELLHTLYSLPQFRLPHEALDKIVAEVTDSDIAVVHEYVDNAKLQTLQTTYDYVYLACGTMVTYKLGIDGEEYVTGADEFLRGDVVGNVIVVGGGNTAMDCARKNARSGGKTTICYRRKISDMPAYAKEVQAAVQDGVAMQTNLAPTRIVRQSDGKLVATFAETINDGRGKLTITDVTHDFVCDYVVAALGNRLDKNTFATDRRVSVDDNGCVGGNLYCGGDAIGHSLVSEAVGDAKRAFAAICNTQGNNIDK